MNRIDDNRYSVVVENGTIVEFYDKKDQLNINLAGNMGLCGSTSFTLVSDDITNQPDKKVFIPYNDRTSKGTVINSNDELITCFDEEYDITTTYKVEDGLLIDIHTNNSEISQFGVNLEFNFLGKVGTPYINQLMPTSPYTSDDKKYTYCIMTRPDGRFLVCMSLIECDGWKIDYSSANYGHYLECFKILSSFDKVYNGSGKKHIKVQIKCAESLEDVYSILQSVYKVPYYRLIAGGNFGEKPVIELSQDTDKVILISPSKKEIVVNVDDEKICKLPCEEYGFYKVIPCNGEIKGIDGYVWYCSDMKQLFDLSCKAIKKPYHGDDNMCEGGCFLWSMLLNMRLHNNLNYDDTAKFELSQVLGKNGVDITRKTIVPYKTERFAPYHISNSVRIQEQFFATSMLLEAYKLYKDEEYLEHAVNALNELVDNWITDEGMITHGRDCTTVCAPIITIVDMANFLKERNDERAERFKKTAILVAEYLIKRGFDFPTEGMGDNSESDAEDGSISCTALSLLYVCANLHYDKRYIDFAGKVLNIHKAFTIYSPDVRMNASSFRWWETIWEGDGQGPAICAGHAWTIWKAEALYLYGMLTCNEDALLDSWNGYISNFAKTNSNGEMYACYEPDFIRGGGKESTKQRLYTLTDEDVPIKYEIAHSYPEHTDNSLSRYAWVRNAYSWYETAAVLKKGNTIFALNGKLDGNTLIVQDNIKKVFIGQMSEDIEIKAQNPINIIKA